MKKVIVRVGVRLHKRDPSTLNVVRESMLRIWTGGIYPTLEVPPHHVEQDDAALEPPRLLTPVEVDTDRARVTLMNKGAVPVPMTVYLHFEDGTHYAIDDFIVVNTPRWVW